MQWLQTEFLGYMDLWEQTVMEREGYTQAAKKNMLLSAETASGIKLTGTLVHTCIMYICCCSCTYCELGYNIILSIMQ